MGTTDPAKGTRNPSGETAAAGTQNPEKGTTHPVAADLINTGTTYPEKGTPYPERKEFR
jgi:hypothetical protein